MSNEFIDPYIDPDTGILRNLIGATTSASFTTAESELVSIRFNEMLGQVTWHITGSLDDLKRIHRYLFQDVFPWAGNTRTVEIRKNVEGSAFFLPSANIVMGTTWAQQQLQQDNMLRGLSQQRFVERLAYHYDNYNFIHPFREGNGRTQRVMWTFIAHEAGYDLRWQQVSGTENDAASRIAAEESNLSPLIKMFGKIVKPCDPSAPIVSQDAGASHLRQTDSASPFD